MIIVLCVIMLLFLVTLHSMARDLGQVEDKLTDFGMFEHRLNLYKEEQKGIIDRQQKEITDKIEEHRECSFCGEIGHKKEMKEIPYSPILGLFTRYYHKRCYEKKYNVKKCDCGEGYVNKTKKGGKK